MNKAKSCFLTFSLLDKYNKFFVWKNLFIVIIRNYVRLENLTF